MPALVDDGHLLSKSRALEKKLNPHATQIQNLAGMSAERERENFI